MNMPSLAKLTEEEKADKGKDNSAGSDKAERVTKRSGDDESVTTVQASNISSGGRKIDNTTLKTKPTTKENAREIGKNVTGAPTAIASPQPLLSPTQPGNIALAMTEQEKKEKERLLMFTRVLMKYLHQRDKRMLLQVKAVIKECYEGNKSGDPNFRSLATSIKARLRSTVGEHYWKKAHDYLDHFLKQKSEEKMKEGMITGATLPPSVGAGAPGPPSCMAKSFQAVATAARSTNNATSKPVGRAPVLEDTSNSERNQKLPTFKDTKSKESPNPKVSNGSKEKSDNPDETDKSELEPKISATPTSTATKSFTPKSNAQKLDTAKPNNANDATSAAEDHAAHSMAKEDAKKSNKRKHSEKLASDVGEKISAKKRKSSSSKGDEARKGKSQVVAVPASNLGSGREMADGEVGITERKNALTNDGSPKNAKKSEKTADGPGAKANLQPDALARPHIQDFWSWQLGQKGNLLSVAVSTLGPDRLGQSTSSKKMRRSKVVESNEEVPISQRKMPPELLAPAAANGQECHIKSAGDALPAHDNSLHLPQCRQDTVECLDVKTGAVVAHEDTQPTQDAINLDGNSSTMATVTQAQPSHVDNQDPRDGVEQGESGKCQGAEQNVSTARDSGFPPPAVATGMEEQSVDFSNGGNSNPIKQEESDDDDDDHAECTYFRVVVSNKDAGTTFDMPKWQKPTFRDLRLQIEDFQKDGDLGNLDVNSKWRFMLDKDTCVPLKREAKWRVGRKDFGLLTHADGTYCNPHCISIKELK